MSVLSAIRLNRDGLAATTTYEWNPRGELAAARLPNGKTESFAYDPLGRLVSISNGEKTTSYVYDSKNVHLEYEGSGSGPASSPSAVYTDGKNPNEVLEMARGGKRYSYLVDGQGSTVALADESGNVVQRYSYDAFGNPTISGSIANPFLYTGQIWEPETGLYYDHARYYEPQSGRFISRDPVQHANPYPYVENDPANATDPTGEQLAADQTIELTGSNTLEAGSVRATLQFFEHAVERATAESLVDVETESKTVLETTTSTVGDPAQALQQASEFAEKLNSVNSAQGPFSTLQRTIAVLVAIPVLIEDVTSAGEYAIPEEAK